MEGRLHRLRHLLVLCLAFLTLACQVTIGLPGGPSSVAPPSAQELSFLDSADRDLILKSLLQASDLPAGWFLAYSEVKQVDGIPVVSVTFRATDERDHEYINVFQKISLYKDESQAEDIFNAKWRDSEPTIVMGQTPKEVQFQSDADGFEIGCLYSTSPRQPENYCAVVARYGRLVSVLYTKTWDEDDEEQWFTWADFQRALEAMDRHALEALGQ